MATRWIVRLPSLLIGLLLIVPHAVAEPKGIVIDSDLHANAGVLKVEMGTAWAGKIFPFKFGEFAVVSSQLGTAVTSASPTQSHTSQESWFILKDAGPETAAVTAAQNINLGRIPSIEFPGGVSIDLELIAGHSDKLIATVVLDGESVSTWTLMLAVTRSLAGLRTDTPVAVLTDGAREIVISAVTSHGPGSEPTGMPGRGYEFTEAGRAVAALQYHGGGLFGLNKSVVYLRKVLDSRDRLLLAAAMTAILQANANAVFSLDG